MSEHIEQLRLLDLAEMDIVVDEPEWLHIQKCEECLLRFKELVRQRLERNAHKDRTVN